MNEKHIVNILINKVTCSVNFIRPSPVSFQYGQAIELVQNYSPRYILRLPNGAIFEMNNPKIINDIGERYIMFSNYNHIKTICESADSKIDKILNELKVLKSIINTSDNYSVEEIKEIRENLTYLKDEFQSIKLKQAIAQDLEHKSYINSLVKYTDFMQDNL